MDNVQGIFFFTFFLFKIESGSALKFLQEFYISFYIYLVLTLKKKKNCFKIGILFLWLRKYKNYYIERVVTLVNIEE